MISILLASRRKGNDNSALPTLVQSLITHAADRNNFEILVRIDSDDEYVDSSVAFDVRVFIGERKRGYADLHLAYEQMLPHISAASKMVWVLADDVIINTQDWDKKLLSEFDKYPDGVFVCNYRMQDFKALNIASVLDSPDNFPVWSRKWIVTMGFGNTFSTDAFSALVSRYLYQSGHDRRINISYLKVRRKMCAADMAGSKRWNTVRKDTLEKLQSAETQIAVIEAAQRIRRILSLSE